MLHRTYKRVAAIVLTFVMIIGCLPVLPAYAETISGWSQTFEYNADGTVMLDKEEYRSAPASLKVTLDSTFTSGGNIHVFQNLSLVAGRQYKVSMSVKAERSATFNLLFDWEKSFALNAFSKTFGWTDLSGIFVPSQSKSYKFWIWVKGETKAVWIDDIQVIDTETGENIVKNGSFSDGVNMSSTGPSADEIAFDDKLAKGTVNLDELFRDMAATDTVAVYKKGSRDIVVDGDTSEWNDINKIYLPMRSSQKVIMLEGHETDNEVWARFMCDDNLLYALIEVKDNKHEAVISDIAWSRDSVQMMLGQNGGNYGVEFTFAFNESGEKWISYGTMNPAYEHLIQFEGKREGDISIYEIAIPWAAQFGECPTEGQACFNFLVNDYDGDGRAYCIEWDPAGISKSKSSATSPQIVIVDDSEEVFGWAQKVIGAKTRTDYTIPFYICNNGPKKKIDVVCEQSGLKETINIDENQVIVRNIKMRWEEVVSDYRLDINVSYDGGNLDMSQSITVDELYDKESVQALADEYRVKAEELRTLMEECNEQGISTDYEQTAVGLLERFADYFEDDIKYDNYRDKGYQNSALEKLYTVAKTDLNAYLNGSKTPKAATKYVTSDQPLRSEGRTVYGMTETNGVLEERPVFFIGYGHFQQAANDYEFFNYIGANANQYTAGPNASREQGWQISTLGNPDYSVTRDTTTKASGNASMKLVYGEAWNANKVVNITQTVAVEPNSKYIFKFKAKSESGTVTGMKIDNFREGAVISGSASIPGGTYDWTECQAEIITAEKQTTMELTWFLNSNRVAWVDDISLCKKGTNKNLIMDPGCEDVGNAKFIFDENTPAVIEVRKYLESAEKNNIAVSMLMSPHILSSQYVSKWYNVADFAVNGALDDEKLLKRWEINLKGWAEVFNEYNSVHSIVIANEPVFYAHSYGDHYVDDWRLFLKDRYESIEKLNAAWKTEFTTFDEIQMLNYGDTSYKGTVQKNDYGIFNTKIASAFYRFTAETLQKYTDIPVTIKILGYMWPAYYDVEGMRGNDMAEYHEFLDWMGCDCMHEIDSSWGNFPHEFWYDYISTFDNSTIVNTEDHNVRDKDAMNERIARYTAGHAWMGALHGLSFCTHWWWESNSDPSKDMSTTIGRRPDVIASFSKATLDLNRLGWQIASVLNEDRDIAILYSTPSAYMKAHEMTWTMGRAWEAAIFNGQQVKIVDDSDMHLIEGCKLLVIPQAEYVEEETLQSIKNYIDKGVRTIILSKDALKYNEKGAPSNPELVNYIFEHSRVIETVSKGGVGGNMENIQSPDPQDFLEMFKEEFMNLGIQYVNVIDNETGRAAMDVEYNLGVYDGKVLVNLIFQNEDEDNKKNVSVYLGNKKVTGGMDLIEMKPLSENIELETWKPVMLEIADVNTFFDTYGHWAENSIIELKKNGIINGISESRFAPQKSITRAEFLALLLRAARFEETEYSGEINDVAADKWYANDVATALKENIILNNDFRPDDAITREEMCDMLVKCYAKEHEVPVGTALSFTDSGDVTFAEVVSQAVSLHFMSGYPDKSFKPKKNATRAEAAAVIQCFLNNDKGTWEDNAQSIGEKI